MNGGKIILPAARPVRYIQTDRQAVIRVAPDVYNMLVELANESAGSLSATASNIIRQAVEKELIEFEKEEGHEGLQSV